MENLVPSTVDAIVANTTTKLSSEAQQSSVQRMDGYAEIIAQARAALKATRSHFHLRAQTTATINVGQAKSLTFSICVRGVTCGTVRVNRAGIVEFRVISVNQEFAPPEEPLRARWTPWIAKNVRAYLDHCRRVADLKFKGREQALQSEFLDEMSGRLSGKKTQLRNFQPVSLAGVPIQLPAPVKPRGKPDSSGFGHLDVLARHKTGDLAVFELKQERPGAGPGALRQAVTYAASFDFLMRREEARPNYWAAFGSKRTAHFPHFHAYAVVCEQDGPALRAEWDDLKQSNFAQMTLGVFVYSRRGDRFSISSLPRT